MAQTALNPALVDKARSGVIEDPALRLCRQTARDIRHGGTVSEEAAELFLLCAGPLLDELADYRARAAAALELDTPDNVVPIRGPR